MEENVILLEVGTGIRIIHEVVVMMMMIFIALKIKKLRQTSRKKLFKVKIFIIFFTTSNI
jgi:membrane-anchored protein YejM (alkaline phosphatase superfamily)